MVTDYAGARDVLKARLDAVFEPETFAGLYPGAAKAPKVTLGFPVNEPPFYVAVDEIVDAAATSGGASMGHAQVDFTLHAWLHAQHADLKTASDTLLDYIDAVFGCVMADPQLNFTVENSFPSIETAGTAADSSKKYIAAASVAVSCQVYSACPGGLADVVRAANEGMRKEAAHAGDGD